MNFRNVLFLFFAVLVNKLVAQAPGCPNVDAGPDTPVTCINNCVDLNATFLETGLTTDYTISRVPFSPPFPPTGGTPTSVNMDDIWSSIIPLPFNFCFYGNTFNEILVGSNGNITFDTVNNNPGGFCNYILNTTDLLPVITSSLVGNSINGVFHDIDPRFGNANINYSVIGAAPCRTFVVNYARVPIFGPGAGATASDETTTQIVLYETTNVVEIYVRAKPDTSSATGNGSAGPNASRAVMGMQNSTGTVAHVPPGRNTGVWSAAAEAWRFTPSGNMNWTFSWVDSSGTVLSNNPMYTHCVTQDETITAQVDYVSCDNTTITVTDDVIITTPNPVIDLGPDIDDCDTIIPITLDSGITSTSGLIEWFRNSVLIPMENGPTLTVAQDGSYEVTYTEGTCLASDTINITLSPAPTANVANDITLCDDVTNDGMENFNLTLNDADILGTQDPTLFTVTYYNTQVDADAGTNSLNATTYDNTSSPQTIYARVTANSNIDCFGTSTFDIIVDTRAIANPAMDLIVCDDASNDGFEIFDLTSNNSDILGAQNPADVNINFYPTQADADAGINAIVNPANYTNTTQSETIFVRAENAANSTCFTTTSFTIQVDTTPAAIMPTDIVLCDDVSNDGVEQFNLSQQDAAVYGAQSTTAFDISYHISQSDADAGINDLPLNYTNTTSPQTIYARLENPNNLECASTTTFDIIVNPRPDVLLGNTLDLCDDPTGDGVEDFDLSSNDTIILNGLNPVDFTITYYENQADADAGVSNVTSPYTNTAASQTIFVRVENNTTTCFSITSFQINLLDIPVDNGAIDIAECDDNMDGVATFNLSGNTASIVGNQSGITVSYYESQVDATAGSNSVSDTSYDNSSSPQTIFYRSENNDGCFITGSFSIIAAQAPPTTMPAAITLCDEGSNSASIDLTTLDATASNNAANVTVSYYVTQSDADTSTNPLATDYSYTGAQTVFIRVQDTASDCFSTTSVSLDVELLPQPVLLDEYVICRGQSGALVNGPAVLDTGLSTVDNTFEWLVDGVIIAGENDATLDATVAGNYEVVVSSRSLGCENTAQTTVRQSGPPQVFNVDITTDPFDKDHQVIVTATRPDQYWFRLDDGPYVNSGIFNDVTPGPHSITIAERNGCGEIIEEIFVFGYPDYFTPNNDGFHDFWNIIGGDRLPGTQVYIFDRYGKLLKQIATDGIGWDGTYNGQPLPSSDYWFKIDFVFEDRTYEATGHFALKR